MAKKQLAIVTIVSIVVAALISLISGGGASALYTRAEIEEKLSNGVQTAVNWDWNTCREHLKDYSSVYFDSSGGGQLRTGGINSGASYKTNTWLSQAGQGNISVPISVAYGTTSISLQVNSVVFLCGPLVNADFGESTSINGAKIVNDTTRWVQKASDENDRYPNRVGSNWMYPSRTYTYTLITDISVAPSPDTTYGGTTTGAEGNTIKISRSNTSRYWIAPPIPVTYKPAIPITKNGKVTVYMKYKEFSAYHSTDLYAATKRCALPDGSVYQVVNGNMDITRCKENTRTLAVTITVPENYALTPKLTTSPPVVTSDNPVISVNPSVTNAGPTASSSVEWRVTRFFVAPGNNYVTKGAGSYIPCEKYTGHISGTCQTIKSGSRDFALGNTNLGSFDDALNGQPYGTEVCYVTSVNPQSTASATWLHTAPQCSVYGKRPLVQIWGHDLRTGSALIAAGNNGAAQVVGVVDNIDSTTYKGDWVEYGIFAPGQVTNVASGSGLNEPNIGPSQALWSRLTFANDKGATYGAYADAAGMGTLPDIAKYFSQPGVKGALIVPNNTSGVVNFTGATEFGVYIIPNGTARITSNIKNPKGTDNKAAGDILQMVIIAKRIEIDRTVQEVDSWLISTTGEIDTCGDFKGTLTTDECKLPLTIRGALIARDLSLRRTGGEDGDPAEIINLRSDAFLWANHVSSQNSTLRTTYTKELPPRY